MMKIINFKWFSGRYTVGAVLVETVAGYKAYIGPAMDINEGADAKFIANWGAKLDVHIARAIFDEIREGKKYDGRIVKAQT